MVGSLGAAVRWLAWPASRLAIDRPACGPRSGPSARPPASTGPCRLRRSDRDRFRLEVARPIAVEPALTEAQAAPQHLLEHLALQGANGRVGLGQRVVGAGMLAEDRDRAALGPGHLGLD